MSQQLIKLRTDCLVMLYENFMVMLTIYNRTQINLVNVNANHKKTSKVPVSIS